ncbi:globin domain-containing protein [Echinicola shivajiensis]|uniref:globin domain-containing protein n=1 Tax=Echinicola shivajiensis TaxID=1035916 RepID=UPI001BFC9F67|nr:cyanoglobin [Echinicola shivajiensis]
MNEFQTVYQAIGEEKIKELTRYFYEGVESNETLRSIYPEELAPAEERLYLFLLQVFGGPTTYSEERGHPRLRMRHLQWAIDDKMRNHWLNNMLNALDRIDVDQNVKELMMSYFVKVANHMINRQ